MAIPLLQKATGGAQKIEDRIRPYQFLSGSALKVIAILAMTQSVEKVQLMLGFFYYP